ncbi:SDR family NAD(P)-dependent oxidoreductase [Biostraticola tofi]|uniref:NAD(P)-dependent dehydrogenase (Short-subunit alcohol dehydrogenase family) n=1 Tax=Biostraticola tofi TaxID=466109 RepID=A0A4R3YYK0_9GAMM|nr:SDR family oxidoreductase [Biostraticola tofi]TCV98337.1 NAD(P)-dependent dehydrogenase (short-subunit alcohol dehydrogenase family) [Biostraticola tofi]
MSTSTSSAVKAPVPNSSALKGKIAVITGGGSGIGLAVVERFVAEGAYVFIMGRRQAVLDQAVAALGDNVEAIAGDVTASEDLDRLYARVKAQKGIIDILVTASGIAECASLAETGPEHIDQIFATNSRATLFSVQKALPLMSAGGSVVLIGSIAGFIGTPGYGTYGATKAAVRSYARTWSNELAGRSIRVNTLSPGPIDTSMFDNVSDELRQSAIDMIPLRRLGRATEVAAAALFLASDESSYITGAELCIDGGMAQV